MSKDFLDQIKDLSSDTLEHLLKFLLTDDEDIWMKTDLPKPEVATRVRFIAQWMKAEGYPLTGELINDYMEIYARCRVSTNRLSRTEAHNAITALLEKRQSMADKLLGSTEKN